MEDLMREEIAAVEGYTPSKHRRYADWRKSNARSLSCSPMIGAQLPGTGTVRGVPRPGGVGGPRIFAIGQRTQQHLQHLAIM